MERSVNPWRYRIAMACAVAAAAWLGGAAPAEAQQRMRVLVPEFEAKEPVRGNFGRDVAQQVQRGLDDMATHQPVARNDLRDQLRRFNLNERELTCIPAMQLATRAGWELVMCGEFEPAPSGAMLVNARVISPESQETFEIEPFEARNPRDAGVRIVQAFEGYTQYLSTAVICQEYVDSQQWDTALEQCERALQVNPRGQTPLYARAFALMNLERNEEALAGFQTMLEHYPSHQDAMLAAGIVATRLGQRDVAMRYFNAYLEMEPGNVQVRMTVASDIFEAGDPVAALEVIEEGLRGQEEPDIAMIEYAGIFAVAAAQKAQEASPANGNDAEARRYFAQALGYLERVYEHRGAEADAAVLRQMLAVYVGLDRTEQALEFGRRAVESHGDDAQLVSAYATALHSAGRTDEALAMLDRVERIDPEFRQLNARRGTWQLQAGNLSAAAASLRRAVERDEINADELAQRIAAMGFNQRGQRGQHQQAIQWYETARQFARSDLSRAMINFFHGYSLLQLGIQQQEPGTCASARATLPTFRRALEMVQNAAAYREQAQNRAALISNLEQYIDIQNAILAQPRCRG
jgi:tetratricopeptide (TPR) repeat protein